MAKETLKYTVERQNDSSWYVVRVYRMLDGQDREIHIEPAMTFWGGKLHAKRWIKKWAKRKVGQRSYMNLVTVDRKW
ncbi:hypothetical protein SEA_FAUST_231 [Streptomyces phage Faust]|uniref:Uncharacterized protein n=1 Tax=Streptomyces phage Faust TaxID=2767565 RepID=A0A7G9UZ48_9CAUD|nr:hypothetical protein PP456_gp056 [Streptomyces phage Faust]QNN99303.1 hypothetical protein SEA_FAUST_231 [Streptomyces phage Faust]